MKKVLFLFVVIFCTVLNAMAAVSKTINVNTAGTLSTLLTTTEKTTVTELTVTGVIDARDVKCMRDEMTVLAVLDMSAVQIVAYTGTAGTYPNSITYPVNQMPQYSFYNYSTSAGKISLTGIQLPSSIVSIGTYAFYGCSGFTGSLNLPASIVSIGSCAFSYCSGFTGSLTLPASVASIGSYAFSNCSGFTGSLTLPSSLTSISDYVFRDCSGFTDSLILPASITSIGNSAFYHCTGFTGSLTLPTGITSIGENAFSGCSGFRGTLTLPVSVNSIGNYAFIDCSGFGKIISLNLIPPTIVSATFVRVSAVVFVPSAAVIAYKSATNWSDMTITTERNITINNTTAGSLAATILTAGYGPLYTITGLTVTGNLNSVDIQQINSNMLVLTDLNMAGAIIVGNALSDNAFQNKTTLCSMQLPTNLTTVGNNAFYGCSKLSGNLTIPNTVSFIGSSAFRGCSGLTGTLTLAVSLTSIGDNAFNGCSGFTGNLILPASVSYIGSSAFQGCRGLTGSLIIPAAVSYIGSYTFYGCSGFNRLNLNKAISSISYNAFDGCSSLTKITAPRSIPPTISASTFTGVNKETCTLEVPIGTGISYQTANYWGLFILVSEVAMADTYGITVQVGTNGTVTQNGTTVGNSSVLTINTGEAKTFVITPAAGYAIATLTYNGINVKSQLSGNSYTTPAVTTNATLSVTFSKIQVKLSVKSAETGTANLLCDYGSTFSFDFTPASGYRLNSVFYNGTDVTSSLVSGVYTTPALTANSILSVVFSDIVMGAPAIAANRVKVIPGFSEIFIDGTNKGEAIQLYDVNGRLVQSVLSVGERLALPAERNTIYLLKTQYQTFKVIL